MKILLISSNTSTSPYPVYPIGLDIIANALRTTGHRVQIFDWLAAKQQIAKFAETISEFKPEIIGISIRNLDNVNALEEETYLDAPATLTATTRKIAPGVKVVLGGSGFSIMPEAVLDFVGADFGIVGEGEKVFPWLISQISSGKPPPKQILRNSQTLEGTEIGRGSYSDETLAFYQQAGTIMPIQSKRGCKNHCIYCTYPCLEGHRLRCRPPEEVITDMKKLRDKGADFIFFTDSVFNDRDGHYLELVKAIEKHGEILPWTAFFQPDPKINQDKIKRMAATGLHSVELGPDASSDTTLKALGKNFSFDDVLRCNQAFADEQIAVANYFMLGGPGETYDTIETGIRNIGKLDMAVSFVFLGIRILPGTGLHQLAIKEAVIKTDTPLLKPVYYFSPALNREKLDARLKADLGKMKRCIYPPSAMDHGVQILRQMGYRGNLWEMMVANSKRLPKQGNQQ